MPEEEKRDLSPFSLSLSLSIFEVTDWEREKKRSGR